MRARLSWSLCAYFGAECCCLRYVYEIAVVCRLCEAKDIAGPALSHRGAVIAVVSYGGNGSYDPSNPAGSCLGKAARNTYTRVAPFADLVEKAFKLANHTPQLE
jgi:hypothetical protein